MDMYTLLYLKWITDKDLYTLLYLKWITNKDALLYSTGKSAQCYMETWMREEFGGEWIHVYVRAKVKKKKRRHCSRLKKKRIQWYLCKKSGYCVR